MSSKIERNEERTFCMKCMSLIYPYEEMMTCNCDRPWNHFFWDDEYPAYWIPCEVDMVITLLRDYYKDE